MKDVDPESDEETPYECFECGNIIIAEDSPASVPTVAARCETVECRSNDHGIRIHYQPRRDGGLDSRIC